MIIHQNHLRAYRKRSELTQQDVAFILELSDYANISRCEQGLRKPNLDILLGYHIIFDIPVESLFTRLKQELADRVIKRLDLRIAELKADALDEKINRRMGFLKHTLSRLTASAAPSL